MVTLEHFYFVNKEGIDTDSDFKFKKRLLRDLSRNFIPTLNGDESIKDIMKEYILEEGMLIRYLVPPILNIPVLSFVKPGKPSLNIPIKRLVYKKPQSESEIVKPTLRYLSAQTSLYTQTKINARKQCCHFCEKQIINNSDIHIHHHNISFHEILESFLLDTLEDFPPLDYTTLTGFNDDFDKRWQDYHDSKVEYVIGHKKCHEEHHKKPKPKPKPKPKQFNEVEFDKMIDILASF